jgi:hypothetical protein
MMLGAFAETSAAAVPQRSCRAVAANVAFCSQPKSASINSMKFRTGLRKGPIKLEYGLIKKVEVAASTIVIHSSVLVRFFAASH